VAAGGAGAPTGFDHHAFNTHEQRRLAAVPGEHLFRRLAARREETLSWVEGLEDELLDRMGRHPALGEITVEGIIEAIHGHHLLHVRDVLGPLT
jgi:hypothetical protein